MNASIKTDAEFCGKVPLHQTNLVQPHGYLLITDKEQLRILQVGENVEELFQKPVKEIISTPLTDYVPAEQVQQLKGRFASTLTGRLPFVLSFGTARLLTTVKPQEDYYIVEIEKKQSFKEADSFLSIYQELKYIMAAIEQTRTTTEACDVAIRELKKLSGFDKIMIYRFDEEWNGDVIAEIMEEGMESYLGLKFPASDIPKQARDLYQNTPYRLIPNVDYTPVKLYPVINPLTRSFTNLSDSNLRSVAAVHLEYLRNMKVAASMSTRILKDNQLWGLIACHHRTPNYLSFELCSVFELLSAAISAKIAAVQKADEFEFKTKRLQLQNSVLENLYQANDYPGWDERLLPLLSADGVAVVLNGNIRTIGNTPEENAIEDLVMWLQSQENNKLYIQTSLPSVYEPAEAYADVASGLLALPLQPEKKSFILAFRPEALQKVKWGGNPNESIRFEADGKNYHPRSSFKLWQQTVTQTALHWKPEEIDIADGFRNSVIEWILNKIED